MDETIHVFFATEKDDEEACYAVFRVEITPGKISSAFEGTYYDLKAVLDKFPGATELDTMEIQ